jgi:hypothetical protein
MTRTQILLPNDLYQAARELAARKELPLAELCRRGLEYMVAIHAPAASAKKPWTLPEPVESGWMGLSPAQLKEAAQDDEKRLPAPLRPRKRP